MRVFQASIEQMLWPRSASTTGAGDTDASDPIYDIDRTPSVATSRCRRLCADRCVRCQHDEPVVAVAVSARWRHHDRAVPKGLPVNLLANCTAVGGWIRSSVAPRGANAEVADRPQALSRHGAGQRDRRADGERHREGWDRCAGAEQVPDFEVNRGHYFGTGMVGSEPALSDSDKRALIEFLKTF
jgi:hypothetical protein